MGILHAYWSNLIASYGGGVDDSLGCDIFLEIYVWIQSLCQDYVVSLRAASSHFSDIQSFSFQQICKFQFQQICIFQITKIFRFQNFEFIFIVVACSLLC